MTEAFDTTVATAPPIGYQDISSLPVEEVTQQSYLARTLMAGRETLRPNAVRVGGSGLVAFGVAGGAAITLAESSTSARTIPKVRVAAAPGKSECAQYQDIMSPGQVEQAILQPQADTGQSIVGTALSAVRRAGPSGKHATHQPGSTFGSEMDVYYRARLGDSNKQGTYVFEIDYDGRLTPNNVKSIKLSEVPGTFSGIYWRSHAQYLRDRYDFQISRGDYGGEGPKALEWWVSLDYGQKKNPAGGFDLYSTQADGARLGKPNLNLTPATLSSVGSQFIHAAKSAEAHRPIQYQPILPSLTNERACLD